MRKKMFCLITTLLIFSSFVSFNVCMSFAEKNVPSPTPLKTIPPRPTVLLPGICQAVIKTDFSFTNERVLSGFQLLENPGAVDSKGNILVSNYTNGLNRFIVTKPGYLSRTVDLRIGMAENPIIMWAGDLNGDASINMSDIMIIASIFNTSEGNEDYNNICDFDMDNSINMADIMIAASHFGKTSDQYPVFDSSTIY